MTISGQLKPKFDHGLMLQNEAYIRCIDLTHGLTIIPHHTLGPLLMFFIPINNNAKLQKVFALLLLLPFRLLVNFFFSPP